MAEMFLPYQGFVNSLRRQVGHKMSAREIENQLKWNSAKILKDAKDSREMGSLADISNYLIECLHYTASHNVIYLSSQLAKGFENSKICCSPNQLRLPFSLFEVCFQEDMGLPSMLVSYAMSPAASNGYINLAESWGVPIPEDRLKCQESLGDLLEMWWSAESPTGPMTCNSTFSLKLTKGLTIEDALQTCPAEDSLVIPIPPIEMETRKRLLRIALCVIAYLNTSDPDADKNYRDSHRPHFGMTPPNGMLLGGRFHLSPNWHLRKGHLRFLADEKFRREKDGSVRVIWVHEAEVNPEKRPGAAQERPYMIE